MQNLATFLLTIVIITPLQILIVILFKEILNAPLSISDTSKTTSKFSFGLHKKLSKVATSFGNGIMQISNKLFPFTMVMSDEIKSDRNDFAKSFEKIKKEAINHNLLLNEKKIKKIYDVSANYERYHDNFQSTNNQMRDWSSRITLFLQLGKSNNNDNTNHNLLKAEEIFHTLHEALCQHIRNQIQNKSFNRILVQNKWKIQFTNEDTLDTNFVFLYRDQIIRRIAHSIAVGDDILTKLYHYHSQ